MIKTKWISHLSRSFYFACVYQPASHLTCLIFLHWNDMRNRSSFSLPLCVVFFPNVVLWYCISLLFKFLLYFHYPYKCVNVNEWLFSSALVNFIDWFNTAFDIIPEQKCVIHPPTLCTLCVCVSLLCRRHTMDHHHHYFTTLWLHLMQILTSLWKYWIFIQWLMRFCWMKNLFNGLYFFHTRVFFFGKSFQSIW